MNNSNLYRRPTEGLREGRGCSETCRCPPPAPAAESSPPWPPDSAWPSGSWGAGSVPPVPGWGGCPGCGWLSCGSSGFPAVWSLCCSTETTNRTLKPLLQYWNHWQNLQASVAVLKPLTEPSSLCCSTETTNRTSQHVLFVCRTHLS